MLKKVIPFVLLSILISANANVSAVSTTTTDKCDEACWQQRYYQLQKQRIDNKQKRFEQMMKEQQKLRQAQEQKERAELRQKKLNEIRERCAKEDMNKASFEEKSICGAVKGYFTYGTPVPDNLLGLDEIQ